MNHLFMNHLFISSVFLRYFLRLRLFTSSSACLSTPLSPMPVLSNAFTSCLELQVELCRTTELQVPSKAVTKINFFACFTTLFEKAIRDPAPPLPGKQ